MDTDYNDNSAFDTSFDVDADYKPTPLVIGGTYHGTVKEVKLNSKLAAVEFNIVLDGNDGVTCTDGETEVDGIEVDAKLWLPKANDKNEMNKKGNMTKFQSKVNMMKSFSERTGFNVQSFAQIKEAIDEQEWIGAAVLAKVDVETYQGRQFNRCNDFSKDTTVEDD